MRPLHVEFHVDASASRRRWWVVGVMAVVLLVLHGGAWHLERAHRVQQAEQDRRVQEARAAAERAAQARARVARMPVLDELSRVQLRQYRFDLDAVLAPIEKTAVDGVKPLGLVVEPGVGHAVLDVEYRHPSALLAYLDALNLVSPGVQWELTAAQAPPGSAASTAAAPGQARVRGRVAGVSAQRDAPQAR